MQTSFKTGDKAVYPGQGVGEVMGIEHTEVAGQRQSFYVLRILENGMRIMIPINKVGSVGLREIISEDDVRQVYAILREKGHLGRLHHLEPPVPGVHGEDQDWLRSSRSPRCCATSTS